MSVCLSVSVCVGLSVCDSHNSTNKSQEREIWTFVVGRLIKRVIPSIIQISVTMIRSVLQRRILPVTTTNPPLTEFPKS